MNLIQTAVKRAICPPSYDSIALYSLSNPDTRPIKLVLETEERDTSLGHSWASEFSLFPDTEQTHHSFPKRTNGNDSS